MKRKIGTNRKSDDLFMPDFFDKELALKRWPERKLNLRETDYTGIKINGWTFMYPVEKQKNNNMWVAWCDCGTVRTVNVASVKAGRSQSCGCKGQSANGIKLKPGMIWNSIKILKDTGERTLKGEVIFLCEDKYGVQFKDKSTNIKNGNTKSAGLSQGELWCHNLLKEAGHEIITHYKVDLNDFIGEYDLYVDNKYFIEYDGAQHFKNIFDDDENSLKYTRNHDLAKNKYCFDKNIPLIRISKDFTLITLEDLLLETSEYIFTKEKEKKYYDINN